MAFVVVNAKIAWDNTGAAKEIPILLTPSGPLTPLIEYCLNIRRSLAWMKKLLRAVRLFLEYLEVNADVTADERGLFSNFNWTLRLGSFNLASGLDPSGLGWPGMVAPDANQVILMLSEFFDWLGRNQGNERATKFNPSYAGGHHDQLLDQRAYQYRRNKAFLGHTWSKNPTETPGRTTRSEQLPKVAPAREPEFPDERFEELLFKGFKARGRHDWRGMLITLLLHGGGLRVSEPFHLFMSDVQPHWDDPSIAFVAVHHPSLGAAPYKWRDPLTGRHGNRQRYLAQEFGLTPRQDVGGSVHAGWKHPMLDKEWFMQVWWLPPNYYGRLFLQIWERYMEQVTGIERDHPYAFINTKRKLGAIYTIKSYFKAYEAAIERIGLTPSKGEGTTPHGGRHAFGRRAARAQIHSKIIQRLMHHCSPDSQAVYTQPQLEDMQKALKSAFATLNSATTRYDPREASRLVQAF